jgi:UDP-N-acetylmuramoyl-tripeptide--D-alanyl-D-alanine ligase
MSDYQDTIELQNKATIYRDTIDIPIIAIGGSNGKTTTNDLIFNLLNTQFNTTATKRNKNGDRGIPITVLEIKKETQIAVIEVGTRHFGDLKTACDIVKPTHVLITNIGKEHLAFFKDLNGVYQEESELYRYVNLTNGIAFINNDDEYLKRFEFNINNNITYGSSNNCDIQLYKIIDKMFCEFIVKDNIKNEKYLIKSNLLGKGNIYNILGSIAVASTWGITVDNLQKVIASFNSPRDRLNKVKVNDYIFLNDAFSANPDSVSNALEVFHNIKHNGRKILVLGDMLELGTSTESEHKAIENQIKKYNFDNTISYGNYFNLKNHFQNVRDIIRYLRANLIPNDMILIKGSRKLKMEEILYHFRIRGNMPT